jgi:hypothetical protein
MMKLSSLVLVLAVGCGGGNSRPNVPDSGPGIDSPPEVNCTLVDTAASTSAMAVGGFDTSADPNTAEFVVQTDINADAAPDISTILLFDGFGVFAAGGIPPGAQTINITGDEAQFATCGACLLAGTDADAEGAFIDDYLVTSGTLNLTSVTQTSIAGTITNAVFTHVEIDQETAMSTPASDGCSAQIDSIAFNVVPMDITPMAKPTKQERLAALRSLRLRR